MHKINFYPIGNADSTLLEVDDQTKEGRLLLFDFGNEGTGAEGDKRVDLEKELRAKLKGRSYFGFDVVAFSHLDGDHICGSSEFFEFTWATKYQGSDRAKIKELWVPAAVLVEDACDGDARVIQEEARHRFRQKSGIRVFSRPERLNDWMQKNKIPWEGREDLVTDAGQLVPGYNDKVKHGVEFFVHSPFGHRQDQCTVVVRNDDCLVMQATFHTPGHLGGRDTRLILSADVIAEVLSEIVQITRGHKRDERLKWDIFKLPHHCSYRSLALSGNKGKDRTEPLPDIQWLFEQGENGGRIISTSDPIPTVETTQPPHFQTANTHRETVRKIGGEFLVTMEHPSKSCPEPLVFKLDNFGVTLEKAVIGGACSILGTPAPRAGGDD
jgi:glyoxylase-like metal-dependent hydrolase (beta-lactamase superfamily II)